jgi:23S rRNA (cytidine2498-2'-O)-methyltransferase
MPPPRFIFVTCQIGAERAVKADLARFMPECRLAFSRPGFLTFKLPADHALADDFHPPSAFARAYGFSLGKVSGETPEKLARAAWDLACELPVDHLHVFERDAARPGENGYEPTISATAREIRTLLSKSHRQPNRVAKVHRYRTRPARRGRLVLDCVLVEPDEWWIGCHRVRREESRWPGGIIPVSLPPDAVSRAWLKMEEALRWSRLPIRAGARVAELGSAPGGSSQALLDRGYEVLGVDPAEMDARVLEHPRFTHVRSRARQVRRREFRKVKWIAADMNVAPNYALDVIESIVSHPLVSVRGLLLTLKLTDWSLAERLPQWLLRIRGWGYNIVHARQLVHNRQEVCVAALMKPFRRKPPRKPP